MCLSLAIRRFLGGCQTVVHVAEKSRHCISPTERFARTWFISRVLGHETSRLLSQFSGGRDTREESTVCCYQNRDAPLLTRYNLSGRRNRQEACGDLSLWSQRKHQTVIYCILLNVCFLQRSKGILLGVVGTDVPVKELLKTIPKYKVRH